jgi:hypothetical protein
MAKLVLHWICTYWAERTHCGLSRDFRREAVYSVTGKKENAAQRRRVTCKNCKRKLKGQLNC